MEPGVAPPPPPAAAPSTARSRDGPARAPPRPRDLHRSARTTARTHSAGGVWSQRPGAHCCPRQRGEQRGGGGGGGGGPVHCRACVRGGVGGDLSGESEGGRERSCDGNPSLGQSASSTRSARRGARVHRAGALGGRRPIPARGPFRAQGPLTLPCTAWTAPRWRHCWHAASAPWTPRRPQRRPHRRSPCSASPRSRCGSAGARRCRR